jgi:epoxyqueuosine reductase
MDNEEAIKREARRLGFSHAGICAVGGEERVPFLREWLRQGFQGTMTWMEDPRRQAPRCVLDRVRSIVVVGMSYHRPEYGEPPEAVVSRYARGADYHDVMRPLLRELAGFIAACSPGTVVKTWVDTGPVAEKYWACRAGIGWIGKHTNLISRRGGSWLFLGALLTDLELEPDLPARGFCGTCTRCIEACPTRAIVSPGVLDARLCISYLTIELRGPIPPELRPLIGGRIFGCDDCQEVCPWNRFAFNGDRRLAPDPDLPAPALADHLQLGPDDFRRRFAGTCVLRARYRGFIRNCLVAAGNLRKPELRPHLARWAGSDDAMLQEHAVWALAQYEQPQSALRNTKCQG